MKRELDIQQLVLGNILLNYPSNRVKEKLGLEALLKKDLGLLTSEIYRLGLIIERDLQLHGLAFLKDEQIFSWNTVSDIIKTVSDLTFK